MRTLRNYNAYVHMTDMTEKTRTAKTSLKGKAYLRICTKKEYERKLKLQITPLPFTIHLMI